jgi:hypothetical protein
MGVPRDLKCSIKAVGPDGSTIPNGGSIFGKPGNNVSVEFRATNDSKESTKFSWKGVVIYHGAKVQPEIPAAWITLKPAETKVVGKQTFALTMPQSDVKSRMLVDIGNFVVETDETNNVASLHFTPTLITT